MSLFKCHIHFRRIKFRLIEPVTPDFLRRSYGYTHERSAERC